MLNGDKFRNNPMVTWYLKAIFKKNKPINYSNII